MLIACVQSVLNSPEYFSSRIYNTTKNPQSSKYFSEREKGHVDFNVYMTWAKAAGGLAVAIILFFGYAIDQGVIISSKW